MAKRKADTGICIPRRSPRIQEMAEEERKLALARITARITDIIGFPGVDDVDEFNFLFHTKTIFTVARPPEADLPKDDTIRHLYVVSIVERFVDLLSRSDLMVTKLTFENVPVDEEQLKLILRKCCTSTLKSITIKGDYHQGDGNGWYNLSKAFSAQGPGPVKNYQQKWTYELPRGTVLESISFEPGLKQPTCNDIRALYYLVLKNKHLKSIKVLNSDNRQVKGAIIISKRHNEDFMQETLNILLERALNTYHAKLEQLGTDMDRSLYINLKALLWSQTVEKLLSDPSSIPGIFDKDDHSILYGFERVDNITNGFEEDNGAL